MNSRKFYFKLFEYKNDYSQLRKDVASLLNEDGKYKEDMKSVFVKEIISKFSYI